MPSLEDASYGLNLAGADPAQLLRALGEAAVRLATKPGVVVDAIRELTLEQAAVGFDFAHALLGKDGTPPVRPERGDRRFSDRAWVENPFLRAWLQSYLVASRWAERTLARADLAPSTQRKARLAVRLAVDAAAPSNVVPLHPEVVKEAVDTGGLSLARGFANFVGDVLRNRGLPQQVEPDAFEVGKDLAATPGRVVFRNHLFELLQYEPRTETVYAEPIVYSPPWINKYYVMDLAPRRSFVEHAVGRGFTVFAISYRNPDESLSHLRLEDYLNDGLLPALDQARAITDAQRANLLGLCLGGTLATIALGVLHARGRADEIGWLTLVNALVDYSDPGEVAAFTDEEGIRRIERRIARRGYLTHAEMNATFTWLRANELVWSYVAPRWGMGRPSPAFDVLAWNADGTRLPAAMHSQYLRMCYLENRLGSGRFEFDGTAVDLASVDQPAYVVGSERDHIAPWRTVYRTTQLVGGEPRFVLSNGGHIVGIISEPGSPKSAYRTRQDTPPTPQEWRAGAELRQASWWEDWADWAAQRSGERVPPPPLADGEAAPGSYVFER